MTKTVLLKKEASINISPKPPFNFDGTFNKPSHFPDGLSNWDRGKYWQAMRFGGQIHGLIFENKGSVKKPRITLKIYSDFTLGKEKIRQIQEELEWRFQLNEDLSEFSRMCRNDRRFYPISKKWEGMHSSCAHSLYELLMITILLQNATIRRTVQMMQTLLEKYGTRVRFGNREVFALWNPGDMEKVAEEELRSLKIGYRAKFIKRLSGDFSKIDERGLRKMSKDDAEKELMKLYGIGPESARILLFEALHHYDTFKHIAPWQQKIYSRLFYNKPLVSASKISSDINKAYSKYSMLAVHYIWEDIFWKRKAMHIDWLEKEIRM
jgi:3-methyladenine DNA glycosylase/8-oxoguanine DNA glycosylase